MASVVNVWLLTLLALVLAIGIDLYLMKVLGAWIQKRLKESGAPKEAVYIFGAYSPLLTWLKSFWSLSARTEIVSSPREEIEKQPSAGESPPVAAEHALSWSPLSWLEQRGEGFQVFLLLLGVLLFCRGILSFRTDLQLPGNESEYFQYIVQFFIQSLLWDHQFPVWNPYLHTGLPYLADPFLHIYNPVVTIPCLLLGVRVGYRIALVLSYFLAAVGMMKLGRAFGFGKVVSLWLGFMYAFAGQPTAHFFQGQYVFIFSFAWIPWVFYYLVRFTQTRRIEKLVYFALAYALLYYSGNAYYTFLISWLILIFFLFFLFSVSLRPLKIKVDGKFAVSLLAALVLWGGLIAVHFLPMLQFRPYISKGLDVLGSHTPLQIWLDYTSKDTFRQDAYSVLPAREEYYAYIGYVPFAALLLLPFGWKRGRRRWIFYWVMVLIFVVLWIDLDRMPWRDAYYRTYLWSQFRYVIRPLIFGSLAILLLGAFGIDAVWKGFVYEMQCDGAQGSNKLKRLISSFGVLGLSALMFLGVFDTLWTNSKHLLLQEDNLTAYRIVRWMREHDSSEYYVRHNPVGSWHLAMLSSQVRFIDAWYHWMDIRRIDAAERLNRRPVQARPHYVIQSVDAPPPEGRLQLIYQMDGTVIYKVLDSLPIAFKVNEQTLLANSDAELSKEEVEPLTPLFVKTDAVEIIAHGSAKDVLVVLVTHYPGWQVQVDGRKAKLESVSGYLAVRMREGIHKYRFEFRPTVFYLGLLISLMSFGIGLFVIRSEVAAWLWKVKSLMFELRDFWGRIKDRANRWGQTQSVFNPAVFHRGAFLLRSNATFEEGYEADLVVLPKRDNKTQVPVLWAAWKQVTWLLIRSSLSEVSLPSILFAFALLIYLGMRTVRLADFPIYFFTDEAIQTASAAELVRDGFYGPGRVFLPTYFPNGSYWNLSVSVYVQVIPYLLFGKSVFVTRFTSLLLSGLLILILVSALRQTICPRAWWSLLLFLAVTPTWFLHSRTAFETVLFCGFYAGFLGAYLLYIQRSPKYLYLAILMAALGFYTYSPGQVILAVTAVALFALDFRYHWQNRSYLGKGFWLILLLAIPYFRFLSYHQEAPFQHLRNLDSYWFYDLPLVAKIWRYVREYLMGLNPYYWFWPHSIDLNRHTMKGYGHLGLWNLPLIVLGLTVVLRQRRNPPYRVFLVALLAVPSGAALVGVGVTRLLAMAIPAAVLAALGWEWVLSAIQVTRWQKLAQTVLFVLLSGVSLTMTVDSLRNGPTWYQDYGLYGMQYGARQIFEQKVPQLLEQDPQARLFVSSLWANGADVFVRYFLTPEQARRVELGSIDTYLSRKQSLDENTVFFLTPEEFRDALGSPKMRLVGIEGEIPYPNGKTGFYIVRLAYVDNVDEIFAREMELRRQLVTAHVVVDGISAKVRYSQIDDGEIGNLFDQKPETLIRGREANPFILEFEFVSSQPLKGLQAQFGSMDFELSVFLFAEEQAESVQLRREYRGLPPDPSIELMFPQKTSLKKMRIEIRDLRYGEIANIHIRELRFLK